MPTTHTATFPALARTFQWAQRFSRSIAVATILVFLLINAFGVKVPISVQLVVSLVSLGLGIPHGAIDHLITLPFHPRSRFFAFVVIYTLIAVAAGFAIAKWSEWGFRAVLVMSALHFGFGDASYFSERQDSRLATRYSWLGQLSYGLASGMVPVLIPLTDHRAISALNRIQPSLIGWAGSQASFIRSAVIAVAVVAVAVLVACKEQTRAIDLTLLLLLALVTPPLIAFAVYFGCWHAVRHTARLVPKLPKAMEEIRADNVARAIVAAVIPGLYAVLGTLALAALLMVRYPDRFGSSLVWSALVIVWALTVPHMATTARFDIRALSSRSGRG